MKKSTLLILTILSMVAVTAIFFALFNLNSKEISSDNSLGNPQDTLEESDSAPVQNSPEESGSSLINPQGSNPSGGGGGGGGSSAGSSTSSSCNQIQISYALRNFVKRSECLTYSDSVCISKQVTCSVEVQNLDNELTGLFKVEISFVDLQSSSIIQKPVESATIAPQEAEVFNHVILFESQSENGEANKDYTCSFNLIEIPKKNNC